jgi:hypothetical protein
MRTRCLLASFEHAPTKQSATVIAMAVAGLADAKVMPFEGKWLYI